MLNLELAAPFPFSARPINRSEGNPVLEDYRIPLHARSENHSRFAAESHSAQQLSNCLRLGKLESLRQFGWRVIMPPALPWFDDAHRAQVAHPEPVLDFDQPLPPEELVHFLKAQHLSLGERQSISSAPMDVKNASAVIYFLDNQPTHIGMYSPKDGLVESLIHADSEIMMAHPLWQVPSEWGDAYALAYQEK